MYQEWASFCKFSFARKKKNKKQVQIIFLDATLSLFRVEKKEWDIKCKSAASREREKGYIKVQYSAKASD